MIQKLNDFVPKGLILMVKTALYENDIPFGV